MANVVLPDHGSANPAEENNKFVSNIVGAVAAIATQLYHGKFSMC